MPSKPLIAGLPPDLTLSAGYILRLNALDPLTGAEISGVAVSDVSFFVTDLHAGTDDAPRPLLVPSEDFV